MAKSLYCLHSRRFGFRLSLQSKIFSLGRKIMKLKRFAIILLAVAIFASVLAVSASAAEIQPYNNVDQAYSFNFNGSWWQDDLHQYWKENSTSVYIYSKAFPGRYNIYTNGYVNGSWGDYTQRPAVVPGVGEYLIYNTIYESNGYERTYARLGGFRAGGGTASGLWSPDSVGSYPHINP